MEIMPVAPSTSATIGACASSTAVDPPPASLDRETAELSDKEDHLYDIESR
jgi:hypothetical protein